MSNISVLSDLAILARKQRTLLQEFESLPLDCLGHKTLEAMVYRDFHLITNALHSIDSIIAFLLEEHINNDKSKEYNGNNTQS